MGSTPNIYSSKSPSGDIRFFKDCKMNGREFEIVWGLAMLLASPIVSYIFALLCGCFSRQRTADDGAAVTPAAAATISVATPEATATPLAETSAPGLEGIATQLNNGVTAEQPREEPATARRVEEASTLIPSDSATSSTATRSQSLQNHMPSREYADNLVLHNPQSHFPLTNHSTVAATTSAAPPEAIATPVANTSATVLEATTTVRNEVFTQGDPAIARQVEEALTLVPSHAANSSNPATCTSPTHVLGHSQLRHRKPLIDVAVIPASDDPLSPFPPTNRSNRSRSRKLKLLLAVGVLLLVVNPGTTSLKFWNLPRQTAEVDAATGGKPEVLPVGLPAAPTSLHFNGVDGRGVVLPFPSPRKPTFVLSPEVQKVPGAYIETWFRAVESLLIMVRSRELDLQTRDMDSVKGNLFSDTLGQITVEDHTCSRDHTDCDNMNQIKMVLRGFSSVPRQTSKVDAAARGEPAVATPPVGLPVAPTSLHFDVGGRVLDLPFPSPGKPIFVLSPEVQEVSRAYVETWFQAVESLSMMACSYGSSNAWRDRFIGLRPGKTFCFFHPGMAISVDPPRSNTYPLQIG